MKVKHVALVAVASTIALFALPRGSSGDPPLTATVRFGLPQVGSPFPPGSGHDASGHAKDSLVPRPVRSTCQDVTCSSVPPYRTS